MRCIPSISVVGAIALGLLPLLIGCESTASHQVSDTSGSHVMGCKMCYDEAHTVVQAQAKGAQPSRSQVIKKHMCPDCEAEVATYTEDGTPMIKCAKCAPEGVACDKCVPPRAAS